MNLRQSNLRIHEVETIESTNVPSMLPTAEQLMLEFSPVFDGQIGHETCSLNLSSALLFQEYSGIGYWFYWKLYCEQATFSSIRHTCCTFPSFN